MHPFGRRIDEFRQEQRRSDRAIEAAFARRTQVGDFTVQQAAIARPQR
jgi:hypothetical protein